jgi:hypothetical protein
MICRDFRTQTDEERSCSQLSSNHRFFGQANTIDSGPFAGEYFSAVSESIQDIDDEEGEPLICVQCCDVFNDLVLITVWVKAVDAKVCLQFVKLQTLLQMGKDLFLFL